MAGLQYGLGFQADIGGPPSAASAVARGAGLSQELFPGQTALIPGRPTTDGGVRNALANRMDSVFDIGRTQATPGRALDGTYDPVAYMDELWRQAGDPVGVALRNPPTLDIINQFFGTSKSQWTKPQLPLSQAFAGINIPIQLRTEQLVKQSLPSNCKISRKTSFHPSAYPTATFESTTAMDRLFPQDIYPLFSYRPAVPCTRPGATGEALISFADVNKFFRQAASTPRGRFLAHPVYGDAFRNPRNFVRDFELAGWSDGVIGGDQDREQVSMFTDIFTGCISSPNWWIKEDRTTPPPVNGVGLFFSFRRLEIPCPRQSKSWRTVNSSEMGDERVSRYDILPDGLGCKGDPYPTERELRGETIPCYVLTPETEICSGTTNPFIAAARDLGRQLPRIFVGIMRVSESGDPLAQSRFETRVRQGYNPESHEMRTDMSNIPNVDVAMQVGRYH